MAKLKLTEKQMEIFEAMLEREMQAKEEIEIEVIETETTNEEAPIVEENNEANLKIAELLEELEKAKAKNLEWEQLFNSKETEEKKAPVTKRAGWN